MIPDKSDDDAFVFWYPTPSKESVAAYGTLISSWIRAGVVPRQGTPFEVTVRGPEGGAVVKAHSPPRVPEDVDKLLAPYAGTAIAQVKTQADLYLAGAVVRARVEFEYLGEDELSPPRIDPRRDFIQGVLLLPQFWREKAKGYEGGDKGAAAGAIEDALAEKYLIPIADQSKPMAMYSGPEHDNVRWRFTEAELRAPLPPRLSELSRYATFLSPAQVNAVGREHFERLSKTFDWLHKQEPRLKPMCKATQEGGAVLSRWPGALDVEPRFAGALSEEDRASFNRVRAALIPPSHR